MTHKEAYALAMIKAAQRGDTIPNEADFRGHNKKSVCWTMYRENTIHLCQDDSGYWWLCIYGPDGLVTEFGAASTGLVLAKGDRLGWKEATKDLVVPDGCEND